MRIAIVLIPPTESTEKKPPQNAQFFFNLRENLGHFSELPLFRWTSGRRGPIALQDLRSIFLAANTDM